MAAKTTPAPPKYVAKIDAMQSASLAASIHTVCQNACVNASQNLDLVCRVVVIAHAKIEDKNLLLASVCPDTYVDFERVEQMQSPFVHRNAIGDTDAWVDLLLMMDFQEPEGNILEMKKAIPCMYTLHDELKKIDGWTFSDSCRLFVLSNVEKLGCKYTVTRFIAKRLGKMNTELCNKVMEMMAEERHSQSAYQTTLATILRTCVPDGNRLHLAMAAHREKAQSREQAWVLQGHAKVRSRFSLLKLVSQLERERENGTIANDVTDSAMIKISFDDFQRRVRFPNSMSPLWRMRCYLLACQGHLFDFREHVGKVIPGQVCEAVCKQEVVIPDAMDLSNAISTLALHAMPFQQLKAFRNSCFVGYVPSQLSSLNMSNYLHLYVASYQKPDIWKAVWKELYPIMNTQISKNVEIFVRETPFACAEFVDIVRQGSPFK